MMKWQSAQYLALLLAIGSPSYTYSSTATQDATAASSTWESHNREAQFLARVGCHERAVVVAKTAVKLAEQHFGTGHSSVATSLDILAELYCGMGQYAQAEPLLNRSLAIREKALGPNHPEVAKSLDNLAALYGKTKRHKAASSLVARADRIRTMQHAEAHSE
jgi:hypothetical protein